MTTGSVNESFPVDRFGSPTTRRRGRWSYYRGHGWHLDRTGWWLDFDRFDRQGDLQGAYCLFEFDGSRPAEVQHGAVDHYLVGAMEWVEQEHDKGTIREALQW